MIADLTFWIYLALFLSQIYGSIIFVREWIYSTNVSFVFKMFTMLRLSMLYGFGFVLVLRIIYFYDPSRELYLYILQSNLWAFRLAPLLIVLIILDLEMTDRFMNDRMKKWLKKKLIKK